MLGELFAEKTVRSTQANRDSLPECFSGVKVLYRFVLQLFAIDRVVLRICPLSIFCHRAFQTAKSVDLLCKCIQDKAVQCYECSGIVNLAT